MNNAVPVMGRAVASNGPNLSFKNITFVKDPWEVNKGRSLLDVATLFCEYIPTEFSVTSISEKGFVVGVCFCKGIA